MLHSALHQCSFLVQPLGLFTPQRFLVPDSGLLHVHSKTVETQLQSKLSSILSFWNSPTIWSKILDIDNAATDLKLSAVYECRATSKIGAKLW